MKSRRHFLWTVTGTAASVAVVRSAAKPAQFEFKLGTDETASHPLGVAATEFATAVRRESDGRLNITIFPDNQLGSDPSMLLQVQTGALEMNLSGLGVFGSIAPISQLAFLGFAFTNYRTAVNAMNGSLGALVRNAVEPKGFVIMEKTWPSGLQQMASWNHPIRNPDDMQGMKIRAAAGPMATDMLKALGASPVVISMAEYYPALQTHLVDATAGVLPDLLSRKAYEIEKYLSLTNHQYSTFSLVINADKWKALPGDIQAIVRRNSTLYAARATRTTELQTNVAQDVLRRYGMQVNTTDMSSFRARLSGYYAHWKAEFGPTAWAVLEQYTGRLA